MNEQVKLTVWLSTYNQEEYVSQALDSILMQKTNFPFDILAADDCSTDRTQKVILDYQKRYPGKIRTYFTPVNVGGCQKLVDCIDQGLMVGDYIAPLEGDDYWIDENRLQILVDFLDNHPQYSRVSHNRQIVNENGEFLRYDTKPEVLGTTITINEFLNGKLYSDFGSVYRNYYREAGSKYNRLFLASRNVCDFQDMFITQDFGPVFVMDKVLSAYRYRSVAGATNYNSITTQISRCWENIRLARAVESFYRGKYDLTPMIRSNERRIIEHAATHSDPKAIEEFKTRVERSEGSQRMGDQLYLFYRAKDKNALKFLMHQLNGKERILVLFKAAKSGLEHLLNHIRGITPNRKLRGYITNQESVK